MSASLSHTLQATGPILALDIGSGTQDALLALPDTQPENWPRFVLPAPARLVAAAIARCTEARRAVWLHGYNMGGGFAGAVRKHIEAGLPLYATLAASRALGDDEERLQASGIIIQEHCPSHASAIALADFAPGQWQTLLAAAGLPAPSRVLAAVQDHGHHPLPGGNRAGRFALWREMLTQSDGDPIRWLHTTPPAAFTRMVALAHCTGGPVADTGTAAVLAALATPEVLERSHRQGVTVVNMGNSHVLAFLLYRERVYGIYEQHTGLRPVPDILEDLREFRLGWLPDEVVRSQGGHGTAFLKEAIPAEAEGFASTFLLGPQRELLRGHGQCFAPYGDMMLAGCHGLLHAYPAQFESIPS